MFKLYLAIQYGKKLKLIFQFKNYANTRPVTAVPVIKQHLQGTILTQS